MSAYGIDDLDDEEAELDRLAARDRDDYDPRADAGYVAPPKPEPAVHPTQEPRGPARKVGALFYTVVEREQCRPDEAGGPIGGKHTCRDCREPAVVLHADPRSPDPRRVICGGCAGRYLRERVGFASTAEPVERPRGRQ